MSGDIFRGVKQWEMEWKGFEAKLPVFYYDNTALTAIYTASAQRVRTLLPHPDMRPVELSPGRCLVAFTAFEYRKTDIGPYNEFSVAFVITFGKRPVPWLTAMGSMMRRCFSAYVWQLPVTTEIARVGGVEMYGYPKFLADIRFEKGDEWISCSLSSEGQRILTLAGKVLPTARGKATRVRTYSVSEGIPLKANVVMDPLAFAESRRKDSVSLDLGGGHAVSDALRGMGLSEGPILYQYCPRTQAILFAGRNLMDD
jgi:hypothetical protein